MDYPKFIPNRPDGTNKLEGGSQERVAQVISETIKSDSIEKKVIGLSGNWGSGKSNVIRMIDNTLKGSHHVFIFDSWGNQEDLTRRSFLEQLIEFLFDLKLLSNIKKWKDIESELLSKVSKSKTQKYPKIKYYWLFLSLGILLVSVLPSFYENVLKDIQLFDSNILEKWRPFILMYTLPFSFFFAAFVSFTIELIVKMVKNSKEDEKEKQSFSEIFGKLLYWFQGKDIESEATERILEEDPSVSQFRRYFSKIEEEVKGKGGLVIVFDNIDRLNKDKIKALWSSIHTFFAEDTRPIKSWVIIPFDRSKVIEQFDSDSHGFIEKTFSIIYHVNPPIVTDLEKFLENCLKDAFGNENVSQDETDVICRVFDLLTITPTITPRQIINFVNNLVALSKQWQNELTEGVLKHRHLSLFALSKDKILESPHEQLLNRQYLGNSKVLFVNDEKLDTIMSAITFGVSVDKADEVLLGRQIQTALRKGDSERMKDLSSHSAFKKYFQEIYYSSDLHEVIDGLSANLIAIEETYPNELTKNCWTHFASELIKSDDLNQEFQDYHKEILVKVRTSRKKKIVKSLISTSLSHSRDSDELDEFHYGQTIFDLNTFINSNELSISISDHLEPVKFSPSPLLKFIELTKESFGEYKISFEEDDLRSFVVEGNDLGVEKINDEIENLKILPKNGFKLNGLVNHLEDVIKKLPNSRLDDLITAISLLRELTSGALDIQIQESFYDSITPRVLQKNEKAIVVIAVGVLNFSKARNHQTFNQTINKLDESVSKSLSREMLEISSLGLFFEPLLKTPANRFRAILKSAEFFIYDINEMNLDDNLFLIKNFGEILEKILQGSEEHETRLLKLLDDSNLFPLPDIEEIDMRLIKAMNRREFKTINKIHDHVSRYFSSFEKDEFLKLFNELDSKEYEVFQISLEKNVEFNFPNSIYSAINDFVWRKAQKRETLNYELWDYLINILDGRKLKKTFTSVRDIYIKHGEISDDELYGIERGLIKHGMLAQKPNLSTSLFILPMIKSEDDTLFEAFLMSRRTLCKVISKASEAKGETVQAIEAKRKKVQGENRNQLEEVINSLT